jgi:hypothetical protein
MLTIVSLAWMGWAAWDQFGHLSEADVENHSSTAVQERMRDCAGTFKQRYECKENIVIQSGRDTFAAMAGRIAIVILPPILLVTGLHMLNRRRQGEDGPSDDLLKEHHQRRHHRRSSHR